VGVIPIMQKDSVQFKDQKNIAKAHPKDEFTCSSKLFSILCFHVETLAAISVCFSVSAMLARRAFYTRNRDYQSCKIRKHFSKKIYTDKKSDNAKIRCKATIQK
jgi:hypothetical protein